LPPKTPQILWAKSPPLKKTIEKGNGKNGNLREFKRPGMGPQIGTF